jgi:FAD/FMN-containing dehydrogenase
MEAGGSVVGEFSAGRTRGAYARFQLGDVGYGLMHRVKQIFDPYGILNPGVKIDVDQKAMLGILSTDFEIPQLYHN